MLLSLLSKRKLDADSRDAYGFTVRPQHLQRYKEYTTIYKEEESERSEKWNKFFDRQADAAQAVPPEENSSSLRSEEKEQNNEESKDSLKSEVPEQQAEQCCSIEARDDSNGEKSTSSLLVESKEVGPAQKGTRKVQIWSQIRPLLHDIENMMSHRVKKRKTVVGAEMTTAENDLRPVKEARNAGKESEEDSEEIVYDKEMVEGTKDTPEEESCSDEGVDLDTLFPWKQELEFLVHGGIPRDLRGEAWQAFVGVRTRRVELYYQNLLPPESNNNNLLEHDNSGNCTKDPNGDLPCVPRKWTRQIEKDLPRTFPGHPALDETGRSSLRRILLAYAQHNPSVGYCQAMNFFAGILLLMMPEENAFWTLVGIMDDYFDGYFSEELIESQVDQLVFEELMRERFPKLVNHLDYLGVQVAWLSGPWFLSIFVNTLPWESVLRIWDVLLYEGNRVMLFRTALALMELYGPALVTTKDAGDAITLLQSLTGSTFDSSQLVLTACMGFLTVTEDKLKELRVKYRPAILEAAEERSRGKISKESKGLATKLYSFKHDRGTPKKQTNGEDNKLHDADLSHLDSTNLDNFLNGLTIETEAGSVPDLQEQACFRKFLIINKRPLHDYIRAPLLTEYAQVIWLKAELCKMMEEKRSAILRAEELETALMELVKEDNRRQLSAEVEELEQEVTELRQALSDKKEQESAMLQVLMRVEQEQRLTEDARVFAEQDAAAQKYAVRMLEEKYEKAAASLAQMEKRAVMAETMLEATVQYERGQVKAVSSPRSVRGPESPSAVPTKKLGILSFGLGWRDKNKGKPNEELSQSSEGMSPTAKSAETNSNQETQK